jgi:hypothetical protein
MATEALDRLVDSLLYEGYALYPYTPGATKNAMPTPFGIVYPPDYAHLGSHTFDLIRVECVLTHDEGAKVAGTARFLQASGERHEGVARRVEIDATSVEQLLGDGAGAEFSFERGDDGPPLTGRARLRAERVGEGVARMRMCVHNTTELEVPGTELDRPAALLASMLSTHLVLEADGGVFVSPLERFGEVGEAVSECRNVNTWPVLASPDDDAVMGAAIFLPDHPSIAPESLGNLFDNTEIEEALLLHVQTLSDSERTEISEHDPKVREMIERAEGATPEQIMGLHGRMELKDPRAGEEQVEVGEQVIRRGATVVLRPHGRNGGDPYDTILRGRAATVERIYFDYEDGVHLGVTVDEDPGQELMRDSGRYLFFRPEEVELSE